MSPTSGINTEEAVSDFNPFLQLQPLYKRKNKQMPGLN